MSRFGHVLPGRGPWAGVKPFLNRLHLITGLGGLQCMPRRVAGGGHALGGLDVSA